MKVTVTAVTIAAAFALGITLASLVMGIESDQAVGLWVGMCVGAVYGYWLRGRKVRAD